MSRPRTARRPNKDPWVLAVTRGSGFALTLANVRCRQYRRDMVAADSLSFTIASAGNLGHLDTVLGDRGASTHCWCQFHLLTNAELAATSDDARHALLREQVSTLTPPRGLIAYVDGEPAAWCAIEPRSRLVHVVRSKIVTDNSPDPVDDESVWTVSCITVLPAFRRGGVAGELLLAAVNHATALGARRIEAYPTDLVAKGGKLGSGQSNGVLSTFLARGFEVVAPTASGKVLVSLTVG